jgi:hypothetical protein
MRWRGKYLRGEFGGYALDAAGNRQINPEYDSRETYTPRELRSEWIVVGLVGQVPVRAGQPTNPGWRLMVDRGAVRDWFIR